MKCPHCTVTIHESEAEIQLQQDKEGMWHAGFTLCPACFKGIIRLYVKPVYNGQLLSAEGHYLARPKVSGRTPVPPEVPSTFSGDYNEACLVLADSPKASAALSRRCLQHILRDKANVKHQNLDREIQEVLDRNLVPPHIAENLDAIRTTGNFAAHPIKSTSSGEIVEVEPHEAEWNLEVLEELFDFFFVGPARTKARKDAHNKKLADAGKPPLK